MNDPLPDQLTVGKLRALIADAPENTVVALTLPAGFQARPDLTTIANLEARYSGGPVVVLSIRRDQQSQDAA